MASGLSFSGLASGIDSSALIKSLIDQERNLKIKPLETKRTSLSDQNTAFEKLSELLTTLKSKADGFRTINGSAVSFSASSSDETVLSGAASKTAVQASYGVTVTQLAKNSTFSFGSSAGAYTSTTDKISGGSAFSDTVSIVIGDAGSPLDTVNINLTENTSLQDFVTSFNSETSDATASLVNTGTDTSPSYRVVITSKNTGEDKGAIAVTVGSILSSRNAFNSNSQSNAQNAIFSIAGVGTNIERSSNTISNVIDGVTFSLKNAGSSTLSVNVDTNGTSSALKNFVGAYNDVLSYIKEQDTVTRDNSVSNTKNIFGALATSSLDESIVSTLRSALTGSTSTGGVVNVLADLGVSTKRDGTLAFDEAIFKTAIGSDATGTSKVLNRIGDTLANTNGTIDQFTGFGRLIDSSENSNKSETRRINQQINTYEKFIAQREQALVSRFASLEQLIGRLNGAQTALGKLSF